MNCYTDLEYFGETNQELFVSYTGGRKGFIYVYVFDLKQYDSTSTVT